MKSFYKILIGYMIFAVIIGTFGWMPQTAKAYTTLAEWQFNGDYLDYIGQYNGTANGSGISVANNYLSLTNAGSDYVSVADNDNLSFTDGAGTDEAFSISAWVKIPTGGSAVIFSKTNNTANAEYSFSLFNDGSLSIALYDATGVLGNLLYTETDIATAYPSIEYHDTWIHVAATYDGLEATSGLKLYVNGSLTTSTASLKQNYDGMGNTTAVVNIGHRYINDSHWYSDASLDEIKLMSTEMTPAEVSGLFNSESENYRKLDITSTFLNASGDNVASLGASPATTKVIFTPVAEINANDGILVSFGAGITLGTFDGSETALTQIHDSTDIGEGTVDKDTQNVRIIVSSSGDLKAEMTTLTFTGQITTPSSAGTYTVGVSVYDLGTDNTWGTTGDASTADTLEGQGSSAVVFGDFNVEISASVDPTLTLTLSDWYSEPPADPISENGTPGTCALGTLSSTENRLCLYQVTVDTNSAGGYTAFIRDTGNFASGSNEMTDADGTISPGTEEYGIASSSTGYDIAQINDFDGGGVGPSDLAYLWTNRTTTSVNADAVTESDQSFGGATEPVDNSATILMHMANISGITPAGSYSTTTIITVVGNF